jgi:hypothetical protein
VVHANAVLRAALPLLAQQKSWRAAAEIRYNKSMSPNDISTQRQEKVELLRKTAAYYRWSIENYWEFARTERKPRTKRQLQQRLQTILEELASLKLNSVA